MRMFNSFARTVVFSAIAVVTLAGCSRSADSESAATSDASGAAGQAAVSDLESQPDVVKIAVGSKDHTTLVAALKAADLVNSLANAGPFTVFAPTNAAFEQLPAGTVDNLLKPENKSTLVATYVWTRQLVRELASEKGLSPTKYLWRYHRLVAPCTD